MVMAMRSRRANSATEFLTMLPPLERSMGMPPKCRARGPKGPTNAVCLANQVVSRFSTQYGRMPRRKSQFEVCGATIITNFGMSGRFPAMRQPVRRMRRMPKGLRHQDLTCGAPGGGTGKPLFSSGRSGIDALIARDISRVKGRQVEFLTTHGRRRFGGDFRRGAQRL